MLESLSNRQTDRQPVRQTESQAGIRSDRQKVRQLECQTDRRSDSQRSWVAKDPALVLHPLPHLTPDKVESRLSEAVNEGPCTRSAPVCRD